VYESQLPSPPVASSAALQAKSIQASFVDYFDRPATALGLGEGWDMRGRIVGSYPMPLPVATDGFIKDGSYAYAGDSVVYAVRQFDGPVQRMGTLGRFAKTRSGEETTLAMAITPNDKIITDMVHFAANRGVWKLTVRRANGAFEPIADGKFTPILKLDTDYQFAIEAINGTLTAQVPGAEVTKSVDTTSLVGNRAFWEEYPTSTRPAGVVFDFDTVWAAVGGQPLSPVKR
jgi:hypothetical protein